MVINHINTIQYYDHVRVHSKYLNKSSLFIQSSFSTSATSQAAWLLRLHLHLPPGTGYTSHHASHLVHCTAWSGHVTSYSLCLVSSDLSSRKVHQPHFGTDDMIHPFKRISLFDLFQDFAA